MNGKNHIMAVGPLSWIGDNTFHALTYLSLLVATPLRAKTWVERVAAFYPSVRTVGEARQIAQRLAARGTCLSRSLAVAARCPGAQVVIGVVPPAERRHSGVGEVESLPIDAHAWIEIGGVALLDDA